MPRLRYIAPPMVPLAKDASESERLEAYFQWCESNRRMNPSWMLPLGVIKQWYHFFVSEHPFTREFERPT